MTMTSIRRWHSYIGLFIAPSVLFFSLTGAVQLFSLHEAHGGYVPPPLVEKLSSVHKDQVFAPSDHDHDHAAPGPQAAGSAAEGTESHTGKDDDDDKTGLPTLLLKWFFLLVALCLALSTAFGLWMGLTQMRRRPSAWLLVAAGALIPLALLLS